MNILDKIGQKEMDKINADRDTPEFGPGDTLRVDVKVVEGTRERIQAFEGVCIAVKSDGVNSAFTVRKISYGEGVERIFPLYSPRVAGITDVSAVQTHRALLALASASHRNVQASHRFHRISHDAIDLASLQMPDDHCSNHDAQNARLLAWDEIAANLSAHRMLWDVLWSTLDAQNAHHHVQDDLHGSQADQRSAVPNDHDRGTMHHHDESTMIRWHAHREVRGDFGSMNARASAVVVCSLAFSLEKGLAVQSHQPLQTQRRLSVNAGYRASTDARSRTQMKSLHPSHLHDRCGQCDAHSLPRPWVIRS